MSVVHKRSVSFDSTPTSKKLRREELSDARNDSSKPVKEKEQQTEPTVQQHQQQQQHQQRRHHVFVYIRPEGELHVYWIPSSSIDDEMGKLLDEHNDSNNENVDTEAADKLHEFLKTVGEPEVKFEKKDRDIENVYMHRCF